MKRFFIVILIVCLLLSGCGRRGKLLIEPVYLYYPKVEYDYSNADGMIDYEAMDGTGKMEDYLSLLEAYFTEPVDESLFNPFPAETVPLAVQLNGTQLQVTISPEAEALPEHRFNLACTCLAMTCFSFCECDAVAVICGKRSCTVQQDSWLLLDEFIPESVQIPTKENPE